MSQPKGQPGTGWVVTGQREEIKIGSDNQAQDGVTISFRTQYGMIGSVWLPRLQYTPETARAAITATAANMDDVHTLAG